MAVQCFIDGGLGSFEHEMLMPQLQFYRINIFKKWNNDEDEKN